MLVTVGVIVSVFVIVVAVDTGIVIVSVVVLCHWTLTIVDTRMSARVLLGYTSSAKPQPFMSVLGNNDNNND